MMAKRTTEQDSRPADALVVDTNNLPAEVNNSGDLFDEKWQRTWRGFADRMAKAEADRKEAATEKKTAKEALESMFDNAIEATNGKIELGGVVVAVKKGTTISRKDALAELRIKAKEIPDTKIANLFCDAIDKAVAGATTETVKTSVSLKPGRKDEPLNLGSK